MIVPTFTTRRHCWQPLLAWGWVAILCCVVADWNASSLQAAEEPQIVTLVVDYGDGVQKKFSRLPWQEGATVLTALQAAAKHPRGIKPAVQGNGEFTLVIAIDELKNEGNGKNWLYKVNGKLADRSCGIRKLSAGDEVLWLFTDAMP